jgi:hypothetical protein
VKDIMAMNKHIGILHGWILDEEKKPKNDQDKERIKIWLAMINREDQQMQGASFGRRYASEIGRISP